MEIRKEIAGVLKYFSDEALTTDEAIDSILRLFSVVWRSEQLPPNSITDKEHKDLMKALYPKDNSKRFRR